MPSLKPSEATLGPLGAAERARSENKALESLETQASFKDSFWSYTTIKRERWNKAFPYKLALYKKAGGSWIQDSTMPAFTLPIPPESLTISTPLSITTTATLGGIVEEHNGIVFRNISITGTTGVLPLRDVVNAGALDITTSIFAGTATAFGQLANSAQALLGTKEIKNVVQKDLVDSGDLSYSTGYYQWKLLERWFESYAALKKQDAGKGLVMALEIWKDDNIFLVTPMDFSVRRSSTNPMEYMYSLQFRAWKRVKSEAEQDPKFDHLPVARDPNALAEALNALQDAQRVLQGAKAVLKGVRADINQVLFTPLREMTLFCKNVLGVVTVASDLPANLVSDLREPILEFASLGAAGKATGANVSSTFTRAAKAFEDLSVQISKAEIQSGQLSSQSQALTTGASPANKISDNPDDNFDFFNSIKPGDLKLRPAQRRKIEDEKRRVSQLKREDFEKARDSIAAVLSDFEAATGGGNDTYARIYNIPNRAASRAPTDNDFEVIFALNKSLMQANKLAASATINRDEVSALEFIAGLAARSGIAFTQPKSKFMVPFPYGYTLEMLSAQYLGTEDRWHEIAVLNGLMDPYVDEVGFSLALLTNGNGNQVTVATADKLFVNQSVWVSSTTQQRTRRRITKIEQISPTFFILTLSGDQNLGIYTVSAGASIQAFLPNTVNSQQTIFIPSDVEADDTDFRYKSIPGVDYFDPLVRAGGVDLLLTASGDLVVTPDGDGRLAVGLTNIVQKVRIVLNTPRGSLRHHPEFGFPIQVGDSTADLSAQDILTICQELFKGDPTFSGVESAAILKDGPVVKISLGVGIAGTSQVIPVTVQIDR